MGAEYLIDHDPGDASAYHSLGTLLLRIRPRPFSDGLREESGLARFSRPGRRRPSGASRDLARPDDGAAPRADWLPQARDPGADAAPIRAGSAQPIQRIRRVPPAAPWRRRAAGIPRRVTRAGQ